MNKLAFFGVIILGLVLLVTHWAVTLVIGLGPQVVTESYDIMHDIEAFNKELATEVKKTVEEELAKRKADIINQLKNGAIKKDTTCPEKSIFAGEKRFDQNEVEELVKKLNEEVNNLEPRIVNLPSVSAVIARPTHELGPWVQIYGLIGSLLIICGTVFLATALLKRLKTTKQPDD